MTGGYIDPRKSRLEAVQAANKWRVEYENLVSQSQDLRAQIDRKDQDITAAMSDVQKAEQKLRQAEDGFEPLKHELRSKTAHIENERAHLDSATKRRDAVDKNMNTFMEEIAAHEAEMSTEFKKSLSAAEEKELERLSGSTQQLQQQWNDASNGRRDLERRKQFLEVDLRQNLQMKLDQLNSQAFENSAGGGSAGGLSDAQKELKKAQKTLANVTSSLQEIENTMDQVTTQMESLTNDRGQQEQAQQEISAKIEKQQKRMEKTLQRKALLTNQAAECAKNIRELGVLPEEAFDKYEHMEANAVSLDKTDSFSLTHMLTFDIRLHPNSRRLMRL